MTVTDTLPVPGPNARKPEPLVRVRDAYRDYPMGHETVHALRGVSLEIAPANTWRSSGRRGAGSRRCSI